MPEITVCDTKVLYDIRFEAEIASAKASMKYGEEFKPYRCGTHYHITHVDKSKRRGVGKKHWKCPLCGMIMKERKMDSHECQK